jgi:hypothetical protein
MGFVTARARHCALTGCKVNSLFSLTIGDDVYVLPEVESHYWAPTSFPNYNIYADNRNSDIQQIDQEQADKGHSSFGIPSPSPDHQNIYLQQLSTWHYFCNRDHQWPLIELARGWQGKSSDCICAAAWTDRTFMFP